MQRRHWLLSACAALAGAATGCSAARPLRLGTHPWIGHEPLLLARDLRWLPPEVQLQHNRSARDSMADLRAGGLDAATLTLDETLTARAAGVPLVAMLVLDTSSGADALLARPGIDTLADLRGRRVAVERSAVGELMLVKILDAAGMVAADLKVVELPIDAQPEALRQGGIDAAISYEPTASRLQRQGWRRLFDSRSLPDTIVDVLAVRRDRLDSRRSAVEAAVRAHFRGLAHLRVNRPDATYRIASRNDMRPDEVTRALAGVALPDLRHNRRLLAPSESMVAAGRALSRLMADKGLLPWPDNLDDLFDAACLPEEEPAA